MLLKRIAEFLGDRQDVVVFDVGANRGDYARAVVADAGRRARIEAFEPSADAAGVLREWADGVPHVRVHGVGLSSQEHEAVLVGPVPGSRAGSVYDRSRRLDWRDEHRETVKLTTLDNFCAAHGTERIDVLKIDVEGHELEVLRGAALMLQMGRIEAIQFEFGAPNVDGVCWDLFELLCGSFELSRVLRDGLRPIRDYDESHELFAGATNFAAFKRSEA